MAAGPQGWGRRIQSAIYGDGAIGRRPVVPTSPSELERAARRAVSARAWAYLRGGAGAERTMAANRTAFDDHVLVPRMLRDVGSRRLDVELFGRRLPAPVVLAPIGVLSLAHPQADLAVAEAAAERGVPFVFSNQASVPMEVTAAAMADAPRWFQLYVSTEDELVDSFLARAEAVKADAVVVTVDTTMLGWRPRDLDLGSLPFARGEGLAQYTSDPVFRRLIDGAGPAAPPAAITPAAVRTLLSMSARYPGSLVANLRSSLPRAAVDTFLRVYSRPTLTFEDLSALRSRTRLPLVVKGILDPEDAVRAVGAGADGVIVSNHGGRQVDGAIASLDALPGVVRAVGAQVPVLLDSGVRTGSDVAKALALGATAVLIGRPYAYGLAVAGRAGAGAVIDHLIAELDLTLGLCGLDDVRQLDPSRVRQIR